ncbi:thioredoxin family protein [Nocardioides nanhaiensis]|uniref:Thioredoxin domain-containing protein n=1 Tax=Nocardioides nanhaiensis TaxID=1476871 RepID=A0ABP8VUX7_9ACTN
MSPGLVVLVVAVLATAAVGVWRATHDGRFRTRRAREDSGSPGSPAQQAAADAPAAPTAWESVAASVPDVAPGSVGTLLQFSSAFCAPCRATRRVLGEVAEVVPGVAHVEVDAEEHLQLTRTLGILRTPTTLVLDAAGREVSRAGGVPGKPQVINALGAAAEPR